MGLTCTGIRIASSSDAELVVEAVRLGHLPICRTRLSHAQCREIRPGDIYVWLEVPDNAATGTPGLSRWTDGHKWTTSKWKNDSLLYMEVADPGTSLGPPICDDSSRTESGTEQSLSQNDANQLIKQCYSIIYDPTSEQRSHWHLIAYFSIASRPLLQSVQSGHVPCLLNITVPTGQYLAYKKFKADRRQYGDAGPSCSETPSTSSAPKLSTIPPRDGRLHPMSLVVSSSQSSELMSQPRMTSFDPSSLSASPESDRFDKVHPYDSCHHLPPNTQLLPLAQLHGTHLARHRSELDRLHVAALDGCRSSISKLPSSHTTMASRLPSVPHVQDSASSPCSRCVAMGYSTCLQCGSE